MDYVINDNDEVERDIETTPNREQVRYAGFWMRFWAYFIDAVFLFSVRGIVYAPFKLLNDGYPLSFSFWSVKEIVSMTVFILYFVLMTKFFGQTVGKMVVGIKVVKDDLSKLSWSDVFFREFIGRSIHSIFGLGKLLYIMVGFTKEKEGLHDFIADTRVIHIDK